MLREYGSICTENVFQFNWRPNHIFANILLLVPPGCKKVQNPFQVHKILYKKDSEDFSCRIDSSADTRVQRQSPHIDEFKE